MSRKNRTRRADRHPHEATNSIGAALLAAVKSRLEYQVVKGERDARSLVAIPPDMAKNAILRWPENAFGEPKDW